MLNQKWAGEVFPGLYLCSMNPVAASGEAAEPEREDAPLDDAAQSEREYVRERLREELKREPTDEEVSEWLRQHTEGY